MQQWINLLPGKVMLENFCFIKPGKRNVDGQIKEQLFIVVQSSTYCAFDIYYM